MMREKDIPDVEGVRRFGTNSTSDVLGLMYTDRALSSQGYILSTSVSAAAFQI